MLLQRKFVITQSNHEKNTYKAFRDWLLNLKEFSGGTPTEMEYEEMVTFVDSKVTIQDDDDATVAEYYEGYNSQPLPSDQDTADEQDH